MCHPPNALAYLTGGRDQRAARPKDRQQTQHRPPAGYYRHEILEKVRIDRSGLQENFELLLPPKYELNSCEKINSCINLNKTLHCITQDTSSAI